MTKKEKDAIRNSLLCIADKVTFRKDGAIRVRRDFFYRHGYTSSKLMSDTCSIIAGLGYTIDPSCHFDHEEHYNNWPIDSFWLADVRIHEVTNS